MVEMEIQKENAKSGKVSPPGQGRDFGNGKGLVEAPETSGKAALCSIVRLANALEAGRIALSPAKSKGQEGLGDALKRAAKEVRGMDLHVGGGEAPSASQLMDDARKLAEFGRVKQHVLCKELGEELGSSLNNAICLQIHEIQLVLVTVAQMEQISVRLSRGEDLK